MNHFNKRIDPNEKERSRTNTLTNASYECVFYGNCEPFYNQYNNDYPLNNNVIMIG